MRLKLGLGKADLVFTTLDGKAVHPVVFCNAFTFKARAAGLKTKFHALRHLHITYLLKSGVPVQVVSARAGHSRASLRLMLIRICLVMKTSLQPNRLTKFFAALSVPIRCQQPVSAIESKG